MKENLIIPCLAYIDAPAAIDWLCKAFQFEKHQVYFDDNGLVAHAELKLGNAMVMLGSQQRDSRFTKLITHPSQTNGLETQSPYIVISNIDEHYARSKELGARIAIDLMEEHGGKNYSCYDLEGHLWNFGSYNPFTVDTDKSAIEAEMKKLEMNWNKAIEQNDVNSISTFMSDEWTLVSAESGISSKFSFLEAIQSGALQHTQMDFEVRNVHVIGNICTVTKIGTSAGKFRGQPFSYYEWAISTFVRENGMWKSILTMLTPANKD